MADGHHVWQKCPTCNGTGVNEKFIGDQQGVGGVVEDTCPTCDGDKYLLWGWMSKDDQTLPDFLPEV
jgi:DnaJ-class molecular chaperone